MLVSSERVDLNMDFEIVTSLRHSRAHMRSPGMAKVKKDGDGDRRNTSLRLKSRTLKALKIRAIEEDSSVQKIIERLVEDYLAKPGK